MKNVQAEQQLKCGKAEQSIREFEQASSLIGGLFTLTFTSELSKARSKKFTGIGKLYPREVLF